MTETIYLSLGGSVFDTPGVVEELQVLMNSHKKLNFFIVVGGGKRAKDAIDRARKLGATKNSDLDWAGIRATWANAKDFNEYLGNPSPCIYKTPRKLANPTQIMIAGGWKPGRSTDDACAAWAECNGGKRIINLTNIDYVLDKKPGLPGAKKYTHLTWDKYRSFIPKKSTPKLSTPFDPEAARRCQRNSIKVYIIDGKKMQNLKNILDGKPYKGALIE